MDETFDLSVDHEIAAPPEDCFDAFVALYDTEVQNEIDRAGHSASLASPLLRTRLAAVEQQKLDRYQRRYEEYIKTAKAIAAFAE